MALRAIARLTDPALLEHGPLEPAQLDEAEDFLLRDPLDPAPREPPQPERLDHELQERAAQILGYAGAQPPQRVEAADERLLPPRAHRQPDARVDAPHGAAARSA